MAPRFPTIDRTRVFGGAAIVLLTGLALWATGGLGGRGEAPEPTTLGVLTVDPWPAGQPAGEWTTIEVPERLSGLLASAEAVAAGTAARDLPAGALLTAADVTDAGPDGNRTAVNIAVSISRWPGDGPQPGDTAMLIAPGWDCAPHTLPLLDVSESTAVIAADAQLAAQLQAGTWELLEAPDGEGAADWECPTPPQSRAGEILMRVPVDLAGWPGSSPQRGDIAMFVGEGSACASHIATLAGHGETGVVVSADRSLYGLLSAATWQLLPAPADESQWRAWRC